jgi:hypothetical protein
LPEKTLNNLYYISSGYSDTGLDFAWSGLIGPPTGKGSRISGVQGEKPKRAEGSERQDREFLSHEK